MKFKNGHIFCSGKLMEACLTLLESGERHFDYLVKSQFNPEPPFDGEETFTLDERNGR